MKKFLKIIIPFLFILIGICLLGYPWVSQYLFENSVDSIIETYTKKAEQTDEEEKNAMLELARKYNTQLNQAQVTLTDPFTKQETTTTGQIDYDSVLKVNDSGLMATLEVPKISLNLPVYHGTSNDVLESGAGHLEGSSVPIGGVDTHAVLSGHTGLNTAKLFTDLTELEVGNIFFIHILGDTLAYKVCDIFVVEPQDTNYLTIQKGRDLVSLVTCTPYGVNSHRLIVQGERTEYTEEVYEKALEEDSTETESLWMKSYKNAVILGLSVVFIFALIMFITTRIRRYTIQYGEDF